MARMVRTAERIAWDNMRQRCLNPKNPGFRHYGGRGIRICDEWGHFHNFLRDMGPRPSPQHSLERFDNNGPYTATNCCWATRLDQNRNKQWTQRLTCGDETLTIGEWSARTGLTWD